MKYIPSGKSTDSVETLKMLLAIIVLFRKLNDNILWVRITFKNKKKMLIPSNTQIYYSSQGLYFALKKFFTKQPFGFRSANFSLALTLLMLALTLLIFFLILQPKSIKIQNVPLPKLPISNFPHLRFYGQRLYIIGITKSVIFLTSLYKPVSCYAFFKRWLLPSLLSNLCFFVITFTTYHKLSTLYCGLGCCPLDIAPLRAYV